MINSVFILNEVGEVLVEKHWRGLVNRTVCDYFWEEVNKVTGDVGEIPSLITTPRFYIFCVVHRVTKGAGNHLFLLAVAGCDGNAMVPVEFLHRVVEVFEEYFGRGFGEAVITQEFTKVYQLLDEMMDNGCPFITEPNILQAIVPPPSMLGSVVGAMTGSSQLGVDLPVSSSSSTPWRRHGVKYANNEIYFDIVEDIDTIMDPSGALVVCDVVGNVLVSSHLSGMPQLILVFQNPYLLDDVSIHQCVQQKRWDQSRTIEFIPPDGSFKLMSYRVKGGIHPPLGVRPTIRYTETGGKVDVVVTTKQLPGKAFYDNVVIEVPFPKAVASVNLTTTIGSFNFDQKTKVVTWTIGKIETLPRMPALTGTVMLQTGMARPEGNPSVNVQFRINMYTASGIRVDSLTCRESYKPYKGVRSVTRAGKYQIRC
jgi:AP-3 complex subunit mu